MADEKWELVDKSVTMSNNRWGRIFRRTTKYSEGYPSHVSYHLMVEVATWDEAEKPGGTV